MGILRYLLKTQPMARETYKTGDIFELDVKGAKRYVQFLYKDASYLGGDLIRGFDIQNVSGSENIIVSNILFYKHTFLKIGIKMGWKRIGNYPIEKNFVPPLFKLTTDTIAYVKKSYNWKLIQGDKEVILGELPEKYKNLPFASVVSPVVIEKIIELGYDNARYPD